MEINFFDDPAKAPKSRGDVRLKQLGLHLYPDGKRVACGFDLTPFIERPSLEATIWNASGQQAGTLIVITTLEANFSLTMHLRHPEPGPYSVQVDVFYNDPEDNHRVVVDSRRATSEFPQPGESLIINFAEQDSEKNEGA